MSKPHGKACISISSFRMKHTEAARYQAWLGDTGGQVRDCHFGSSDPTHVKSPTIFAQHVRDASRAIIEHRTFTFVVTSRRRLYVTRRENQTSHADVSSSTKKRAIATCARLIANRYQRQSCMRQSNLSKLTRL
jgi:hypothetical protein